MTPADALATLRQAYAHRAAAPTAPGARCVVGYVTHNVPVELIRAAGLEPVQLVGSPDHATPTGDAYMENIFDGAVRSVFDRIITGAFNFCDLIILPRTSEGWLELYYILAEVRKWEPSWKFPDIYLFDLLQTPYWTTGRYVRGRIDDLRARLEQLSGAPMTDDALRAAIAQANRTRGLQGAVDALRHGAPPKLSGTDALTVFGAQGAMPPAEYQAALEGLLSGEPPPVAGTPVRLMVKGSPHDTTRFYALVESCGAVIVADDHETGARQLNGPVEEEGDPWDSLAFYYQTRSFSPRSYPQSEQDERFLHDLATSGAEGVIFFIEEHDDTFGWDYPDQKKALDARGIPSLYLPLQSYRSPDEAALRTAIGHFIAALAGARGRS